MPRKKRTAPKKSPRKKPFVVEHQVVVNKKDIQIQPKRNWFLTMAFALIVGIVTLGILISQNQKPLVNSGNKVDKNPVITNSSAATTPLNPIPKLKDGVEKPVFTAKGIYALDTKTKTVLFAKNENAPLLPASTTKMATALVALNTYQLTDVITVPLKARVWGEIMGLKYGEQITVDELLHGLLISSANDAAETFAQSYPQGYDAFIEQMNKLAESQGLTKTHFTNPVGFDEYLHFSSATDIAKLALLGMDNPEFTKIVMTQNYTAKSIDGKITHPLVNTNKLLGKVDGVIGVKTGTTTASGESLVTLIDRDGHRIIISMLGSNDRFGETTKLIDWIFTNYDWDGSNNSATQ